MNGYLVYTAPWIIPVDGEVIQDGAIVLNSDMIVRIGPRKEILDQWVEADVTHLSGVIIPPLVNCHIHLELSHLAGINGPAANKSMVDWIEDLIQKRSECRLTASEIIEAANKTARQQHDSGVVLLGDIINVADYIPDIERKSPQIYSFYEMLAPNRQRTSEAFKILEEVPLSQAVSPHAVYSTSAQLLTSLKKRCEENDQIFSIHAAESQQEIQFITERSGPFRTFLEKRNSWDGTLLLEGAYSGTIDYLDKIGVLDSSTLCVHCVHIIDEEIAVLAERKAKVCLCPGSNQFLGVGQPPLQRLLDAGIIPGIGTDSLASNETVDLWREMRLLREQYPTVKPSVIFEMATRGGAEALQKSCDYGTLSRGKQPVFLEVDIACTSTSDADSLLDELTAGGRPKDIRWITPFLDM